MKTYNAWMFIHLRIHTEFSVVDGTNRIDELVGLAAQDQQPALAITDLNNLFGAIKFYKECRDNGVKPILGAEIIVEGLGADANAVSRMVLLVQNKQGYLNLSELLARSYTQNTGKAQVVAKLEWLQELSEGLIALSGAQAGPVGKPWSKGTPSVHTNGHCSCQGFLPTAFIWKFNALGAWTTKPTLRPVSLWQHACICPWSRRIRFSFHTPMTLRRMKRGSVFLTESC